jgi:hypothetical protein
MGGVTLAGRWTALVQNTFPTLVLFERKNSLLDLFTYVCSNSRNALHVEYRNKSGTINKGELKSPHSYLVNT